MEIEYSGKKIVFEKELNELDKLAIDFSTILNKAAIKYVIVSGYVSIMFGRNRASEDIDLIIEKINIDKFRELWNNLMETFECLNTSNLDEAYNDYLNARHALRFAKKGKFEPNMEIKFPKLELDNTALHERREVILNGQHFFISIFELQIAFKLYLGSEKDIEDARYLYRLFKDKLDMELLHKFNRNLNIEDRFDKYIK